jgi:1-deoxy-D-xylulose-5-phosphate synthase
MVARGMKAAQILEKEGYNLTVANARFCKPIDEVLVAKLLAEHDHVVTIEDHQLQNGFGSAVLEAANLLKLDARKIERMGIPDQFIHHGSREWQLKQAGIDTDALVAKIRSL